MELKSQPIQILGEIHAMINAILMATKLHNKVSVESLFVHGDYYEISVLVPEPLIPDTYNVFSVMFDPEYNFNICLKTRSFGEEADVDEDLQDEIYGPRDESYLFSDYKDIVRTKMLRALEYWGSKASKELGLS